MRTGNAVDEKNGAKTSIPLTRTRVSVIALRNWVQPVIVVVCNRGSWFVDRGLIHALPQIAPKIPQ
jgi:hypothetical protein